MKSEARPAGTRGGEALPSVFAGLFGAFLGVSLLKFGNPPITERWITAPTQFYEFLFSYPWPINWAYGLLALVTVAGIALALRKPGPQGRARGEAAAPGWLLGLPAIWLAWQIIAGSQSADLTLTRPTVKHFAACVLCFYLGYFALGKVRRCGLFWLGLLSGFMVVLAVGWEQHFGGLEASRRYFFAYVYPQMKEVAPEYIKKLTSTRIFGTLFYPNTLAGAVLLFLPAALAAVWQLRELLTAGARGFLMSVVGLAGLACLYWSGSKGGWLLMLVVGLAGLLRLRFPRRLKVALVTAILLAGLAGFFWKYAEFFQKGATSVSARFDYWRAAAQTCREKPLFGSGPGTFALAYQKVTRPESEMARLVHNDYLEQGSDSGLLGLASYALFIVGALVLGFPGQGAAPTSGADNWLAFAVWLGVLGWSLQSLSEFGLYIPALAWPAFTFLGWLLGKKRAAAGAG